MRLDYQQLRCRLGQLPAPVVPASTPPVRLAAVLVLFVDREETNLLMIRRADRGDPWSNHIALPGGHVDADDATPQAAAYRESEEEVGIAGEAVEHLGELGIFPTQLPDLWVRVFVGHWRGAPPPRAEPSEVAAVFEVPLSTLYDHHQQQGFALQTTAELGARLTYPASQGTIWGVTARILHRLLQLTASP